MFNVRKKKIELQDVGFFITINPNKTIYQFKEEEYMPEFREMLDEMYTNFDRFLTVFTRNGRRMVKSDRKVENIISDPHVEIETEVGDIRGGLHSHSMVKFKAPREYNFRVDLPLLRRYLEHVTGGKCHLDVKFLKDNNVSIEEYINKRHNKEGRTKVEFDE